MKLIDVEKTGEIFVSYVMYTGNEIMEILNKQPDIHCNNWLIILETRGIYNEIWFLLRWRIWTVQFL